MNARTRTDAEFRTFDGIHIPADDKSIDLVFCKAVLSCVRYPDPHVCRVLKPNGLFIGSVSQLEPAVPYLFWNLTPLGLHAVFSAAGMRLVEVRPGMVESPAG